MEKDDELDPEVQEVVEDQKRLARGVSRQTRKINRLGRKALEAIEACDSRALARELRLAGVPEDSEAWRRAWEIFHSCCGR
jgi:hypothetical protein